MEHWTDGLSEDLKGNESLKGFETLDDFAKGHLDLVEKGSKPWTESLSEEFRTEDNLKSLEGINTPEDLAKGYLDLKTRQVIVPEKPEEYEIPDPEGSDLVIDENLKAHFRNLAHKVGLSKEQAKAITEGYNEYMTALIEKIVKDDEAAQVKAREDAENALKDLWKGEAYEKNLEAAKMAIKKLAKATGFDDEELEALKKSYANDTRLMRMFHTLSTKISEDVFEDGIPGAKDKEMSMEQFLKTEVFKGK
jgi:hypothetical protein